MTFYSCALRGADDKNKQRGLIHAKALFFTCFASSTVMCQILHGFQELTYFSVLLFVVVVAVNDMWRYTCKLKVRIQVFTKNTAG